MNNPKNIVTFHADPSAVPSSVTNQKWVNYIQGVVLQYLPDLLPDGNTTFTFDMAIAGDVPLGSGLSSSASLEVATAVFLEAIMTKDGVAMDNSGSSTSCIMNLSERDRKKERAVRCQRAENVFCGVPCGIMVCIVSNITNS